MLERVFRQQVIAAIQVARAALPLSHVHLLYAPGATDPLALGDDGRRPSAPIRPVRQAFGARDELARVITLDCRLVARYLLENDPALDDPLFEASVALAYQEMLRWRDAAPDLAADGSASRVSTVYGWIVTSEDAVQCAARAGHVASPRGHAGELHPLRWYQPDVLYALWPGLDDSQRNGLLGDATWLMCGIPPALQRHAAPAQPQGVVPDAPGARRAQVLRPDQWQLVFNSTAVGVFAGKWHALCEANGWPFPDDAIRELHKHVQAAQAYRFDADDLAIYVMTAVQLAPSALEADEARALLAAAAAEGIPLRDALEGLPDSFWERHARIPVHNNPISSNQDR